MRDRRRVIVIGPQFGGDDGLSELGRQVVAALTRTPDTLLTSPDVTLLRRWVEAELER